MSEFKCAEPGCDYHVGISNGPNLTPEDWESEDYYFQEIEEHQQMHREKTDNEKQDNYFVNVDPETAAWLDGQGLMRSWQNKSGQAVPNPLHVPGRTISDVLSSPFSAACKVPLPSTTGRTGLTEGVELPGGLSGSGRENDRHAAGNKQLLDTLRALNLNPDRRALLERIFNTWREGGEVFVILDQDLVRAVVNVIVGHEASLSVGGAPRGAVGGTSESTERGLTPGVPEMKEPPAVAAAEGDETKHSNGK